MNPGTGELLSSGAVFEERYRIERLLGVGGTAAVYLAHDLQLEKMPVALKVAFSAASDPQLIARCREEANIAQSLSHSCIVQTFSFAIAANGTPYQVMAPVEGVTLRERLAEGQIDVHERFIIAHSVLSAINHLHERGVAHRDLKPSNIFLGSGGEVKLGDFGVALAEKREIDLTRSGELLGTVGYMSPERVRGEVATPASDIFAFGLICFELLANEGVPRDTTAQRIGVDMNSMAAAILSELKRSNDPWSELIVACLAFDPQARPTAEALLARVNNEALRVPKEFLHACRARARRRTVARGTAILFVFYLFALILLRIPGMQPVLLSYAVALDVTHGPALHAGFSRLFGVTTPKSTNASLLHYFVQNGQELGARTLLQHGVSADAPDRDGTTALCGLVHDSEPALISLLLQSQADPNQRCPGGMLIAERAARDDYFALFQQLLQHGAEPTAEAIRKAIDTGSSRIIEVTLQYWGGSFERFARSDEGFLRWMLQREDQDLVEKMLARIQALSSLRVQELPPLAWAAAANRPKLVTTLIDRLHADPLATVGGIHPAWVWAINGNSIETMDALRARGFDIELNYPVYGTPLLIAVRAPQDDVLRQLLAWGVPLNAPMGNSTLLIDTALRLSPERLAKVIGLGADPAYGDISGITPLYWSILYGRWFNVPVLVSRSGWLMNFDQWLRAVRGAGS